MCARSASGRAAVSGCVDDTCRIRSGLGLLLRHVDFAVVRNAAHAATEGAGEELDRRLEGRVGPLLAAVVPVVGRELLGALPVARGARGVAARVKVGAEPELLVG